MNLHFDSGRAKPPGGEALRLDVAGDIRRIIIRYFVGVSGVFVALLLVTAPLRGETSFVVAAYAGLLLLFGSLFVLEKRQPILTGALLSLGSFAFVVALTWARGGINCAPGLTALATMVGFSGLFWCGRGALVVAALSSAAVAWFAATGPATQGMSPFMVWLELSFQFGAIALLAHVVLRTVSRSASEAALHQRARETLEARISRSESVEALGRLAGGVAHDFNNLLTVILCNVELLAARELKPLQRSEVEQIRAAADRAARLTSQLLAFGRKQVLSPKVISPCATLKELEPLLRRVLPVHVELEIHCAEGTGNVEADEARLEQVLVNLVTNARDAMPAGGRIEVRTRSKTLSEPLRSGRDTLAPGRYVEITVKDHGDGMPAEVRSRIFEPFFTTKSSQQGTGLGLAVVHGIVTQSRGLIEVESTSGEGSTFRIHFPETEKPLSISAEPHVPPNRLPGTRILLVEDSDEVRTAATRMLEALGHRVESANDGADALARYGAAAQSFDLLITDIVMPSMSGPDLATRFRSLNPGLRTLFISGYAGDQLESESQLRPGDRYLPKPFSETALSRVLAEILAQPL